MGTLRRILLCHRKNVKVKQVIYLEILKKFASETKVKAVLDERVKEDINPKHHPGIFKFPSVALPKKLINTISSVLKDQPIKTLVKDAKMLRQYLHSRHAPIESLEMKARVSELEKQIRSEDGIDENLLGEEERSHLMEVRAAKLKSLIGQRIYCWKSIDYDEYKSKVYLLARSASNYAVLMKVFNELKIKDPTFSPKTLLDFGSGVGTVIWAVRNSWDKVIEYFCVDKSSHMNDLADLILRDGNINNELPSPGYFFRQFLPSAQTLKYDLVVSAFSLVDLPTSQNRLQTIMNLWNKTSGYLVLIEDGTLAGYKVLNEARDFILEFGSSSKNIANVAAHVVAPCPHDLPCPKIKTKKPCSFPVKYLTIPLEGREESRTALYSYVVLKKGVRSEDSLDWPRLVQPVLTRSKHTICRLCCSNGQIEEIIFTSSKHGKFTYHCARASHWGDLLPVKLSDSTSEE
ncbi:ribosome assembly protein METTL17, mitochondrial [Hetaerina americana]|uniref:ribosome assembly protein METTL17, mitochondrial n=1 Tax=Hetaerina americana TaxID=62018 RepID=UPI003A7F594D